MIKLFIFSRIYYYKFNNIIINNKDSDELKNLKEYVK